MKRILRDLASAALVALAVWTVFTWPLARRAGRAIPSSALNVEKHGYRAMIPGDHLQFLYHFWLTADTAAGGTPWFANVYEFNLGSDADRRAPSTYYLPFSAFFTLGYALGGHAVGWNLTGLMTIWLVYYFTRLLVRRYTPDRRLAAGLALIGILLPYQWITLLDGSPTGLAMLWVPVIAWALDVAVAERKIWAGAVAGAGLYLTEWGDTHVFFFTVLAAPAWCLFSFLFHYAGRRPTAAEWRGLFHAALPIAAWMALVFFQSWEISHELKEKTIGATGRSLHEVALRSPSLSGVIRFVNPGDSRKIYLGAYLLALLAAGWAGALVRRRRGAPVPFPLLPAALLTAGLVGVVLLSTGVKNPAGPRAWEIWMKLVKPYAMIRQPDKVYLLMPTLLAVLAALLWPCLPGLRRLRHPAAAGLLLLAPLIADYKFRVRPTLCWLDPEQGAFRAVAEDARAGGARPHLLSLPLWPGDSHFDSLNEYYVSLYHIRMVNGYGGSVKTRYLNEIFHPFESLNLGVASDAQLDDLLRRGVHYLVLHENLFPEKVSPFPVGYTLRRLLRHPRLRLLAQDGAVRAWKILPAPDTARLPMAQEVTPVFAARRWEIERASNDAARVTADTAAATGDGYVTLAGPAGRSRLPDVYAPLDEPQLGLLVRLKGAGTLETAAVVRGVTNPPLTLASASTAWHWQRVPLPVAADGGAGALGVELRGAGGAVDVDTAILCAGPWIPPPPGGSREWPAGAFFHAGYSMPDLARVVLRKDYEQVTVVLYGPKLPLEAGRYQVDMDFESAAPAGTDLGSLNIRWPGNEETPGVAVRAGRPATHIFEQPDNRPFFLAFRYDRNADMIIRGLKLTRL